MLHVKLNFYQAVSSLTSGIEDPFPPTKQSLSTEVMNKAFAQLKMEKELYPCGIGEGMMNQIRMLALSFNYYKEVDIEQARELLMTAGNVFLNIINSNEQIRPFLRYLCNSFTKEKVFCSCSLHKVKHLSAAGSPLHRFK